MIRIDKDYVVLVDTNGNYTLAVDKHKTKENKNGSISDVFDPIGYYTTLSGALKGCRRKMCSDNFVNGEHTLSDALKTIKDVTERFEKLVENVTEGV